MGLTLSRLYAQYFGGDLKILSLDGFGTDVCARGSSRFASGSKLEVQSPARWKPVEF